MKVEPLRGATRERIIELHYLEHRARLLDIAAFLDRLDRAPGNAQDDFRVEALKRAMSILNDGQPDRARRILEMLSDPTEEPIASAAGMKGAFGAYREPQP